MVARIAILGRVFSLLALAVTGVVVALAAWNSVTTYRTPHGFHGDLEGGPPLAGRVVLVVLDGIRLDALESMPFLQQLANSSASGVVRTGAPSLSNPARAVMVTGAWQEIHGVTNNSRFEPPPVDSLFSLAQHAGVPVAVAGSHFWERAFVEHLDLERTRAHRKGPHFDASAKELIAWQGETCREDLAFLEPHTEGLLVAGITAADSAGHDFGGESEQYRQVVPAVDACIERLVNAMDDGRTTFVVTSDHGHIDSRGHGGHGGLEEEVVNVPLILAGKAIRSGEVWQAEQVDIAPTICALLGLPLPATNQGSILWQALDVPEEAEPNLRERVARQKALAADRLPDTEQIRSAEKRSRGLKALAVFTAAWFVGCGIVLTYRGDWHWLLIAVGIYYALYYAAFLSIGLSYSLSAINRQEYLLFFLSRDVGAAAVAFSAASAFCLYQIRNRGARVVLDLALVLAATLVVQVTWIYFEHGLFMQAVMLDLESAFKAYLDLLQMTALGITAPALALLYSLVIRDKSESVPSTEQSELQIPADKLQAVDEAHSGR